MYLQGLVIDLSVLISGDEDEEDEEEEEEGKKEQQHKQSKEWKHDRMEGI